MNKCLQIATLEIGREEAKLDTCRVIKIGVLGAGHLGKIHLKLLQESSDFELVGFYDPDPEQTEYAVSNLGIKAWENVEALTEAVDALDIVTPTLSHFECASAAMRKVKHVFIEKPVTETLDEAQRLLQLGVEANVVAQVGHVERFNPAYIAAKDHLGQPMFVEAHRLSQFNPRGTDVSVVLDLMIHDIDIILKTVGSNIRRVSATGVSIISETPDIANARLEFDNGAVANLTASRFSLKNMRKTRFFQRNAYVSVDYLNKETEVINISPKTENSNPYALLLEGKTDDMSKVIEVAKPDVKPTNAIGEELAEFANCIQNNLQPTVTLADGLAAIQVANMIIDKMDEQDFAI